MPAASGFDRRGKASWPMRLVIALLFFTIFASRCFAFGAYAVGYDAKRKQFESFLILNRSTAQEAEDIALRACQNKSFTDCAIKYTFSNTCIAIAFTRNRLIRFIDTDPSLEHARTKVMTACESSPGIKCFIGEAGCDRAKAFAPLSQSARDLAIDGKCLPYAGKPHVRFCAGGARAAAGDASGRVFKLRVAALPNEVIEGPRI